MLYTIYSEFEDYRHDGTTRGDANDPEQADEIKYGERVKTFEVSETSKVYDLSAVHHDLDGLRLVPSEVEGWELQVQLKLRDPDADWQEWQYEDDRNRIARQWVPAYRLSLSDEKARYY